MRIREIAAVRIRYGYTRIHVLVRREGWQVITKKPAYRIYCKEGLNFRNKQIRKRAGGSLRLVRQDAQHINDCWSMDCASDGLFNGRWFRLLSVVDIVSRGCLGIKVNQDIKGQDVVTLLDQITWVRGTPRSIRCDNGPEVVSKVLDWRAYEHRVCMDFSRPGKPIDNAFAESFIGNLRDECLNVQWFLSLEDVRNTIEAWRVDYNEYGPHSSLDTGRPVITTDPGFLKPEN